MRTIFTRSNFRRGGQREFAVSRKRESLGKISAKAEMRTDFFAKAKKSVRSVARSNAKGGRLNTYRLLHWSGQRESDSQPKLGKLLFYH